MAATLKHGDKPLAGTVAVKARLNAGRAQRYDQTLGTMAQGVLQTSELTAPLSELAHQLVSDVRAICDVLDDLDSNSAVRSIRPENVPEAGLTGGLTALVNEVATVRMMVESIANRIGRL